MMLKINVFAVMLVVQTLSVHGVSQCFQQLVQQPEFSKCIMDLGSMFTSSGDTGGQTQGSDAMKSVFKTICSPEGRETFQCVLNGLRTCPEMFNDPSMSQMFGDMDPIEMMEDGGLDVACLMFTGECSRLLNCFDIAKNAANPMEGVDAKTLGTTPYSTFQMVAGGMCTGPMHSVMVCIIDVLSHPSCEPVVKMVERRLAPVMKGYQENKLNIGTLNDTKKFTVDLCPAMPQGFVGDKCIMNGLKKPEFESCYNKVMTTNDFSEEQQNCDVYFEAKSCISASMGDCSNSSLSFLAGGTPYIMMNVPKSCETLAPWQATGAAGTLLPSLLTMLLMLVAGLQ